MNLFLTGATGFVGKHLLYFLLQTTEHKIVLPIRGRKGITAEERFEKEIKEFELFQACDLSRLTLVPKDIQHIDASDLSGVSCFIHCAASVKFNQPLDALLKENYEPVKRLAKLCSHIKFIYVSTCYVHPKYLEEAGKPVPIEKGLPREEFICDYAYTKYLAEQYLYEQQSEIDIVRLSCVGAPVEKLTPMRGAAHLGILEVLYRKSLPDIWFPKDFQFSVVPVDTVCQNLIQVIQSKHKGLAITQYAAPAKDPVYNIKAMDLKIDAFEKKTYLWQTVSYQIFVYCMTALYFIVPSILRKILDTNYIISAVSNNIVFESSISLPKLSKDYYLKRTKDYVFEFVQSNPKPTSFWMDFLYDLFLWVKATVLGYLIPLINSKTVSDHEA